MKALTQGEANARRRRIGNGSGPGNGNVVYSAPEVAQQKSCTSLVWPIQ